MTPKLWRKSLGERGLRVYLFERTPGGNLYREAYVGGKRVTKLSLGHRDRERAEADGYRLLAKLKAREEALTEGKLRLSALFDMYVGSPAHEAKKPRTQREDEVRLRTALEFLGLDREIRSLCESDVQRFAQARVKGECGPAGKQVGSRTVQANLVALNTMLNWATRQRGAKGNPLLRFNPLRGVRLPAEKNPRRPVETYDRYLRLMEIASEVDWRLPCALSLAEATAQRIGSILSLRRGDVDLDRLPHGWIRFKAEHQKTGHEHWAALSRELRDILVEQLCRVSEDPKAWLFPVNGKLNRPVTVSVMSKLLREAYSRAKLPLLEGGLWHPWRRKWATERKGMPITDVAAAGGWKDVSTLVECYQQPDDSTLLAVQLDAPKLCEAGIHRGKVTPLSTPHSEETASANTAQRLVR